jgi:hypothetical protein
MTGTGNGPSHLTTEPTRAETSHWARWACNEPDWDWPDGKSVAVTISFDVDAETGAFGNAHRAWAGRGTVRDRIGGGLPGR